MSAFPSGVSQTPVSISHISGLSFVSIFLLLRIRRIIPVMTSMMADILRIRFIVLIVIAQVLQP
ncbi:MAG: hypothetical protein ACI9UJ_002189, partial [bacterium]